MKVCGDPAAARFERPRDVNPLKRAERAMLQDVAYHAERQRRDSIVATRRAP
jgi:hypothetical protein